jgi:hypothetical protein
MITAYIVSMWNSCLSPGATPTFLRSDSHSFVPSTLCGLIKEALGWPSLSGAEHLLSKNEALSSNPSTAKKPYKIKKNGRSGFVKMLDWIYGFTITFFAHYKSVDVFYGLHKEKVVWISAETPSIGITGRDPALCFSHTTLHELFNLSGHSGPNP